MLRNSTFSITDQETGKENNYRSDENGHVYKGWYHDSWNSWYYDPVTGIMATGVVTIDDKTYCFDTYMRVNYAYIQDGILYYFGEDGVLEEQQEITQDGWTSFRGNEYYIRDGELVKGQFITEGDDTYFVDWMVFSIRVRHFQFMMARRILMATIEQMRMDAWLKDGISRKEVMKGTIMMKAEMQLMVSQR